MKNLNLTLDLLLLDGLQNLDHALFAVDDVDTLKDFRVFTTANFANDLVIVLCTRLNVTNTGVVMSKPFQLIPAITYTELTCSTLS